MTGYSFNKDKVIDITAIEKEDSAKKKLSFKDKLNIAGERFNNGVKKINEYREKADAKKFEKLQKDVKVSALEAKLAQNKAKVAKYTPKNKTSDPFDLQFKF